MAEFTDKQHRVLTELHEVFRTANEDASQFGFDGRKLKDGRFVVEEYDEGGEVIDSLEVKVSFA